MINSIISGVCTVLANNFEGATIYTEEVVQGVSSPCFFVYCANAKFSRYRGKRYKAENQICIQYFPPENQKINNTVNNVIDKLFSCTQYIQVEDDLLAGTKAEVKNEDGFVGFYINYDYFVYIRDENELMEKLSVTLGGGENG